MHSEAAASAASAVSSNDSTTGAGQPIHRLSGIVVSLAVLALLFSFAAALQWAGGAYSADFSGHPDEPAHYVTGLMVSDYLRSGLREPPLTYASRYYAHYPKIAMGQWPPMYYAVEALWILLFSESRPSVLLLSAFLTALWALLLWRVARARFGNVIALTLAVLMVASVPVQWATARIMSDVLTAIFVFTAVLALIRYFESASWRYSALFGVLASAAILTKGNGILLALLPPTMLVLTRRWDLLTRTSFWLPVPITALLIGPWYAITVSMVSDTWTYSNWLQFFREAIPFYFEQLLSFWGVAVVLLAAAGYYWKVVAPAVRSSVTSFWAGMGALIPAVLILQCVIPCALETRYLLPALPALALFAAAGAHEIVRRLPAPMNHAGAAAALIVVVFVISGTCRLYVKQPRGAIEAADAIQSTVAFPGAVVLATTVEGGLVAELARRDRERPSSVVLRGTKVLSKTNWTASNYELLYDTPAECMEALDRMGVDAIAVTSNLDTALFEHERVLAETIDRYPSRFQVVADGRIRVLRVVGVSDAEADVPTGRELLDKVYESPLGRIHRKLGRILR